MGKSGRLFASLVNGVKALKSPSKREKSTKENAHSRNERDSAVSKQRCMWNLGKSSSRNKSSVGVSPHPGFEVKDVQVQQLSQGSQRQASSSFHYTDTSLDEITSTLVDEIVREGPPPNESYQEEWATMLKLSDDESEPEQCLTHNPQPEEKAAVKIQAEIRRYLVQQRNKRTLNAVIRLQAMARGRIIRKQAVTTLRCIHALVKFQANARGWLVRTSEVGQLVRRRLEELRIQGPMLLEEELQKEQKNRTQPITFAPDEQLSVYASKQSRSLLHFEPDKEHWGWAWLDRWMAARPWENSSSPITKEKPRITAPDSDTEPDKVAAQGAEIVVNNVEKQNESARSIQMDISIPSEHMAALHEVPPQRNESASSIQVDISIPSENKAALREVPPPPPPPPLPPAPPPLPSFMRAAHRSIKRPVLFATEQSSESASFCASPATLTATELVTENITTESPASDEDNSDFRTFVASDVSLPAEEPEETTLLGTPVDLVATQAEVASPPVDESSPPASSFLQQNESSSSFGPTKEEDRRLNSSPAPSHSVDSQQEDEIDSAESGMNKTSILMDEPVWPTDQENTAMGITFEVSKYENTYGKSPLGTEYNSGLSNAETGNRTAEAVETVKFTKGDSIEGSNDMRGGSVQVKSNGLHHASATPIMVSEASAKRVGSILVKHEQVEGVSQSLPSYMATTKSSTAKARSQASPKRKLESPKQRSISPRHSSGSKKMPASDGKGFLANSRQIMHVRSGSIGQLASIVKDGITDSSLLSLGDSKRHSK